MESGRRWRRSWALTRPEQTCRAPNSIFLVVLLLSSIFWGQDGRHQLALTHVVVINPSETSLHPDTTVLIERDRIVEVGPSKTVKIPRGARVVDASGKFLIPSLWDMHVHTDNAERDFPMFVANGVLGVRNMAGGPQKGFSWEEERASGKNGGPQVVGSRPPIDGPEPRPPGPRHFRQQPGGAKKAVQYA